MHEIIDFELRNISKIEGHANLDLRIKDGKTLYCKLRVSEGKRFITKAIEGLHFNQVPSIV